MIVTYYPHSKSTHNLKFMKFDIKKNSMYVFIMSKVQKYFPTCKWCVIHITYKKMLQLMIKKLKPKDFNIYWKELIL